MASKLSILDIPVEVRILIYESVLSPSGYICTCNKSKIQVHGNRCYCGVYPKTSELDPEWSDGQHSICKYEDKKYKTHLRTAHPQLTLGLLSASRLIAKEALDVLLTCNTFIIELQVGPNITDLGMAPQSLATIQRAFFAVVLDRRAVWTGAVATIQQMKSLQHIGFTGFWREPMGPSKSFTHPRTGRVYEPISSCGSQPLLMALFDDVPHFRNVTWGAKTEPEKAFAAARVPPISVDDIEDQDGYWEEARHVLLEKDARKVLEGRDA